MPNPFERGITGNNEYTQVRPHKSWKNSFRVPLAIAVMAVPPITACGPSILPKEPIPTPTVLAPQSKSVPANQNQVALVKTPETSIGSNE